MEAWQKALIALDTRECKQDSCLHAMSAHRGPASTSVFGGMAPNPAPLRSQPVSPAESCAAVCLETPCRPSGFARLRTAIIILI